MILTAGIYEQIIWGSIRMMSGKFSTFVSLAWGAIRSFGKPKVFCIGRNKTGLTSMKQAFQELGYAVGSPSISKRLHLFQYWTVRDFRRLFLFCLTAQAFADSSFSLPFTFQALDQRFRGSKFILTVRDSPEEWYHSLTHFHAALFGNGQVPTAEDLKQAEYPRKGFMYTFNRTVYHTPEDDPYNKAVLIAHYNAHNNAIVEYFRHRPNDLLILNVAEPDAYNKLCDFLGKPRLNRSFPHKNKTSDFE
mgnify:CR=1 FL=1